jgi:hypothetical protein
MKRDTWKWLDTVMLTDKERASIVGLRASHDRLLAAAKEALAAMSPTGGAQDVLCATIPKLQAAIAAAEEQMK